MEGLDADTLLLAFPRLRNTTWAITSPETPAYNCVAWAAGDDSRWWWPADQYFWPTGAPRSLTVDAFVTAFISLGYSLARDAEWDSRVRKVAIFAGEFGPTHVALQLDAEYWTSKLGSSVDIRHELRALEGPTYGDVRTLLERGAPSSLGAS